MGGALDVDQLRTFVAIDDFGGFGRAADALGLSQPTVSQHVRRLEGVLGRPLVRRDGRRSVFTPDGQELLVEARRILVVHDQAMDRLEATRPKTLIVGAPEALPASVLRTLATGLRAEHPDVDVVFRIDRTARLLDHIRNEVVDLAVVLDVGSALPGRPLGEMPLRWFTTADASPAGSRGISLIGYDETPGLHQKALQLLSEDSRAVQMSAEASSLGGVVESLRAGLGVALLPDSGWAPDGIDVDERLPQAGHAIARLAGRISHDGSITDTVMALLTQQLALLVGATRV